MSRGLRRPVTAEPVRTGLYAVRRGVPQLVVAGDRMRGVPCLACGYPAGAEPVVTVVVTHYVPDVMAAGNLPSTAWLMHASHHGITTRAIHDLAEWRLGGHHH